MIVYSATKQEFLQDSANLGVEYQIAQSYLRKTGRYAPPAELNAWRESLRHMASVLDDAGIPEDAGIGIEFGIPQTAKRIDFLISGMAEDGRSHVIIVELKQWSSASLSDRDGIIVANRGGGVPREGAHPSYQAWSYAALLEGFNEAVHEGGVSLDPCAFLHNYVRDGVIDHPHYAPYLEKAPVFLSGVQEQDRLRAFIRKFVSRGDKAELLYRLENGRIRPSKMLADAVAGMLKGNREFVLVDDQKLVYETALARAKAASADRKQVVIIRGGPGTGKSVVAINLVVALTRAGLLTRYVSKNAAPRSVYSERLRGIVPRAQIAGLFSGSGVFHEMEPNAFNTLVVDEAHRLNERSGLYGNLGENQIKEVIRSAHCAVFFVDDDQIVTLSDIGHSNELRRWAEESRAEVTELELASQFRCNGSDGYLAWIDHMLEIRETANQTLDPADFDFRVLDSPAELHRLIEEKNAERNRARVVAGYCWDWSSKRDPDVFDIHFPEHEYMRRWNLSVDGSLWIMAPTSVNEVGCIHTCQGLEVDYIGVIVGPDLVLREGAVATDPTRRSSMDRSIRGYRTRMRTDPAGTTAQVDRIIRNTYRTLMTRGLKGCYVFCSDPGLRHHLRSALRAGSN